MLSVTQDKATDAPRNGMSGVRRALREATRPDHDRVDQLFGRFDLRSPRGYGAFLSAHARVLPPLEAMLCSAALWDGWTPRAPALLADLQDLELAPPTPLPLTTSSSARGELWGMLYVLEGSRLGGLVLARGLAPGSPRRYLTSGHTDGGWLGFQAALEAACDHDNLSWLPDALNGARTTFERFAHSATVTVAEL